MDKITYKFQPDYTTYANPNRLFSNDWAHFLIWIGGRGIGKTTGLAFSVLGNFIKRGEEFVYCRRYAEEMKYAKDFLVPIANNIKMHNIGKALLEYRFNKVRLGYCCALSGQQKLKSGVDFSKVTTLIFDEAILASGARYLPNEIEAYFLELVSTIFRQRRNYRVIVVGNNANIFNPYFEYLRVPEFKNIYRDIPRGLYIEKSKNSPKLIELEQQTPLFNLTKGTAYADYHYNNEALVLYTGKLGEKPQDAYLIARFIYNSVTLNIYYCAKDISIFVELRKKVIDDKLSFSLFVNHIPNYGGRRYFKSTDTFTAIEMCFYDDAIIYDCQESIGIMNEIMDML